MATGGIFQLITNDGKQDKPSVLNSRQQGRKALSL